MSDPSPLTPPGTPGSVLFGAAYYAEYHRTARLAEDLDLMVEAGFTVIRVGESVWSTWEPREGEFDLEWLLPVLDGAHDRGIKVILGTPTYAVPPWMQQAYPEIAAERQTGQPIPFGARQEVDYSHPAFRYFAERIIRKVTERYADHPAVIGFQVDNEPGLELFHNQGAFTRFVRWLRKQYGTVEQLNREWGLTYWSHRIDDWAELWRPDGNSLPQYDLAWRRYQAELTTDFIGWQADIVREYASAEQFVTTCINYPRDAHDDRALTERLDVTAGNPYYSMQDHLDAALELEPQTHWTTSGVAGLYRQADRLWSSKQDRFLVTETNAQMIDGSANNQPAWPGQLRSAALALISRGASMIEYWHWHTLPYGTETYWGGVLPHSLQPGRVYREIAQIGTDLRSIGNALDGFDPDADVAVLWSNPSRWAMQFFPPFNRDNVPLRDSYERIVDAFHRGVVDAGAQARVLHVKQATAIGAAALAERFPVLVAAGLYVATDDELDLLREYAAAGGHLILGPRTGYGDEEARARVAVAPDRLAAAAGVHYEEFSNVPTPVSVDRDGTIVGGGDLWVDGLLADTADTVATYAHPRFRDFAAVTTAAHGDGRITTVGTIPTRELAVAVIRGVVTGAVADALLPDRELPLTVTSGRTAAGHRVWFVANWSWSEQTITLHQAVTDATDGTAHEAGTSITLPSWLTVVLIGE
ncbi:cellulase family glycosylhydrolase [Curtobacterium albidum]|uniref:beta-galactosidase n=1 Tax=Curtobacterium citreum TaxID=2036 RepID=A0A850DXP5_9MICO|nr:beta-galactosidase [Curtobacterium albidum]NUU29198.1 cellulase family glycosylhydrolase [Curtobacterium albidum]